MRLDVKRAACVVILWVVVSADSFGQQEAPDLRTVTADLELPAIVEGSPRAGQRVRETLPAWSETEVYHVTYLPTDYDPGRRYPVVVEYAGNGGFTSPHGDVSTGVPEGSKLGFGISRGAEFIWVCLPYLSADGQHNVIRWWGDAPTYEVEPTLRYCKQAVPWICEKYGGDPARVLLVGFSRGAIACNFIGLHDDEIAKLWCGFVAYSHYDGVRSWPYPGSDQGSAITRLKRLGSRPQWICHEGTGSNLDATRHWIESTGIEGSFTFTPTGFRNHNDAWVLRPSYARTELRKWIAQVCGED